MLITAIWIFLSFKFVIAMSNIKERKTQGMSLTVSMERNMITQWQPLNTFSLATFVV